MCNIHQPYSIEMVFSEPLGKQMQEMLLPHQLFADIYHRHKRTWAMTIRGPEGQLLEFWDAQKKYHPLFQDGQHPLKSLDCSRCIPLCLHGDEVPISGLGKSWVKKMVNFSWSSLLRSGTTKDSSYWVWGMLEKIGVTSEGPEAAHVHRSCKNKTLNEFFRILRWSFYWLWMGIWPQSDVDGKKYLGCITFVYFLLVFSSFCTVFSNDD